MRQHRITALLVVVLACSSAHAADREQVEVEKVLRDNGLSPRSRPSWDEKFAIKVSGTEQKPGFVPAACTQGQIGRKSIQGKRFTYSSDDRGEWGGELKVREGESPERTIVPGNIRELIPFEKDLYVFTGLTHLSLSYGALHVIEDYDTNPRERFLTRLPEAAEVVALDRNWRGFLIVSPLSISVADLRGGLSMVMARHAYLPDPNSVLTIGSADILVGLCGGVAWVHTPWRMNHPPDPADEIPIVTYWTRQ